MRKTRMLWWMFWILVAAMLLNAAFLWHMIGRIEAMEKRLSDAETTVGQQIDRMLNSVAMMEDDVMIRVERFTGSSKFAVEEDIRWVTEGDVPREPGFRWLGNSFHEKSGTVLGFFAKGGE